LQALGLPFSFLFLQFLAKCLLEKRKELGVAKLAHETVGVGWREA